MKTVFRLIAVLLAAAAAASAGAQEAVCKTIESELRGDPIKMLGFLGARFCLGEENDAAAITKSVRPLLAKPASGATQPGDVVDAALRQVGDYVHSAARDRKEKSQEILAALALEIEAVRNRFRAQQPLSELNVEAWVWDKARFRGLPSVNAAPLRIACPPAETAECVEAGETGKVALRAASLVRQTLKFSQNDIYEQALAATRVRRAKWDAYFDDARVQFPWELGANSYFHKWLGRDKGGFAEPPNDQLIFLHPGIGMEYVSGAPAGSRFEAALVLEIIGYNRWSWTKEGKIDTAWGASFIQTYSDRAGLSSMRPGVMLHYQSKYSVAFTRKNSETGILLSIDLAKLVTKTEDDAREKFKLGK